MCAHIQCRCWGTISTAPEPLPKCSPCHQWPRLPVLVLCFSAAYVAWWGYCNYCGDWVSSWTAKEMWFIFWQDKGFFLPDWLWGMSGLIRCILGALSLRLNQLRHEAGHSHPPVAEVKIEWSHTSACPFAFVTCTGRAVTFPLNVLAVCVWGFVWCRFACKKERPTLTVERSLLLPHFVQGWYKWSPWPTAKHLEILIFKNPSCGICTPRVIRTSRGECGPWL